MNKQEKLISFLLFALIAASLVFIFVYNNMKNEIAMLKIKIDEQYPEQIAELQDEIDYWKDKYENLSEDYTVLRKKLPPSLYDDEGVIITDTTQ